MQHDSFIELFAIELRMTLTLTFRMGQGTMYLYTMTFRMVQGTMYLYTMTFRMDQGTMYLYTMTFRMGQGTMYLYTMTFRMGQGTMYLYTIRKPIDDFPCIGNICPICYRLRNIHLQHLYDLDFDL